MRLYVHHSASPDPLVIDEIDASVTTREIVENRVDLGEGHVVYIEDIEVTVSEEITLLEAGIGDRAHVHVGPRRRIGVRVSYAGVDLEETFAPSATVAKIHKWAVGSDGFDLAPDQRAKHVLQLVGTDKRPAPETHLGSLSGDRAEVAFDLVAKKRIEG